MNDSNQENELFVFDNDEDDEDNFPLALPIIQREQEKELIQRIYKLKLDLTITKNKTSIVSIKSFIKIRYMYQNICVDVRSFGIICISINRDVRY